VVAYLPPVTKPGQARPALPAAAATLTRAAGVTGHGGPYPVVWTVIRARGLTAGAETEGRLQAASAVDQPKLTAGRWVRPGQVVIERTFAEALGVGVGDRVTLDGRAFTVGGIAVTAAAPPYPNLCYVGGGGCMGDIPAGAGISPRDLGFVWVTEPDALGLATPADPVSSYVLDLKLSDPARAQAFAAAHGTGPGAGPAAGPGPGAGPSGLVPWTGIATADGLLVLDEQQVLSPGALLAVLLAVASVAVLAGGRMAEHTRRTGLLKAVGAGPGLVAAVFLAENLLLALASAAAGLAIGRLAAPLITSPGAALIGTPGAPSLTLSIAAEVVAVAVAVALAATLVPAIRAARTSTISALAGTARTPRRRPGLIAASRHLPVPLLIGLRLVARRTRRALLGAASITVTTAGIVAVLAFHVTASRKLGTVTSGLSNPVIDRDEQMLLVLTVVLVTLTVLNAICAAWTTVLDTRAASALARALGATPRQVGAGIAAAQVIPAVPGALLGVPLGIGLYAAAGHSGRTPVPPAWWLAAAVLGTVLAVAALASVPALAGTRRPVAEILQAETA
jgi:putative ABC transport system permease protein